MRRISALLAWMACLWGIMGQALGKTGADGTVAVCLDGPASTFVPSRALGVGIDGQELGDVERTFLPQNLSRMLSAGLMPLSYRLRTELGGAAWHWNPRGRWSEAKHRQGYWTSDAHSDEPILLSYGYRLPRRGNTVDEANDDGYSRLDDGDPSTFWKSNPYLSSRFTGEEDSRHPQWVVMDLGSSRPINAMRILWGTPYAIRFKVEYSEEGNVYFGGNPPGVWRTFLHGNIENGKGGDDLLRLAERPVSARYLRVSMTAGSGTAPEGSTDLRDRLGYAIREIEVGLVEPSGRFRDLVTHAPGKRQTLVYVSSTDPWHREADRDDRLEQPGFDLVYQSGMARGLPMLVPVAMLYDTPENAAAQVAFLKAREYRFDRVEMGEEPDGQRVAPDDFAALYLQFADAIHKVAPELELGGPSFVTLDWDKVSSTYRFDHRGWIRTFLGYLARRNRSGDFRFLSFEWYPFDDFSEPTASQIQRAPAMLERAVRLARECVPASVPLVISEYNYSVFPGQPEVDMAGALLNAEIAAQFLTLKGETAYFYGYSLNRLRCVLGASWGNHTLFLQDDQGRARSPVASYYAMRMLARCWAQPEGDEHQVYLADSNVKNHRGEAWVTAYAVRRPDRCWAMLLINKSPQRSIQISFRFNRGNREVPAPWRGPFDLWQLSSNEYAWQPKGAEGFPSRCEPPAHRVVDAGAGAAFTLPPWSLTVVRSRPSP